MHVDHPEACLLLWQENAYLIAGQRQGSHAFGDFDHIRTGTHLLETLGVELPTSRVLSVRQTESKDDVVGWGRSDHQGQLSHRGQF